MESLRDRVHPPCHGGGYAKRAGAWLDSRDSGGAPERYLRTARSRRHVTSFKTGALPRYSSSNS